MKNITITITLLVSLIIVKPDYAQTFFEEIPIPDTVFIQCMEVNGNGDIFLGSLAEIGGGGVYRLLKGDSLWECVYPFPNGGDPLSIEITENGTIYVGTNSGYWEPYLLRSNDNGYTWEGVDVPGSESVSSIFSSGVDSIILGMNPYNPIVIYSTDAGQTWDSNPVTTVNQNYVWDFAITADQTLYLAMMCFTSNHGGVYKSIDFGETWEFDGLLNHQVSSVAVNSKGDLFSGDWYVTSSVPAGLYCKRYGSDEYQLVHEVMGIGDLVVTKQDYVYACTDYWIFNTPDYGQTINIINDSLSLKMEHLDIDNDGYLYACHSLRLIKSLQPICFGVNIFEKKENCFSVFPNPVFDKLYVTNLTKGIDSKVMLFDVKGNFLFQKNIYMNDHYLDTSDLIPGVYFLYIEDSSNDISIIKILKL